LNAEKSRYIKEKSAIPFEVTFDGGLDKYSGLLDIAKMTGHVECPKMGWYTRPSIEDDKSWRRKNTSTEEFWEPLLSDKEFLDAVKNLYSLESGSLFNHKVAEALNSGEVDINDLNFDEETGEILD